MGLGAVFSRIVATIVLGMLPDVIRASAGPNAHVRLISGIVSAPMDVVARIPAIAMLFSVSKCITVSIEYYEY